MGMKNGRRTRTPRQEGRRGRVIESPRANARETNLPPTHFARFEAALRHRDAAALAVRDVWLVYLKIDPQRNDLRDDPRFKAIMSEVGF